MPSIQMFGRVTSCRILGGVGAMQRDGDATQSYEIDLTILCKRLERWVRKGWVRLSF